MSTTKTSSVTCSCTPHYKEDADKPWVTLESEQAYSIWLSPKSSMTLEDAAKKIENFEERQVYQQLAEEAALNPLANYNYQGTVCNMTFQGQVIQRSHMTDYSAKDYMREGESFNLLFTQTFRATVNPLVLFCPCVVCCGRKT